MSISNRARQRFDSLRTKGLEGVDFSQMSVDLPSGWCISTIARLQTNAPEVIARVETIQRELAPVADLYLYPRESLHLSMLGCTQREEHPQTSDSGRVLAIQNVVQGVVGKYSPVRMSLGRLNLLGTQFFVEVVTDQDDWSRMRTDLAFGLEAIGERPIAYADTEPVHLNVARILSVPNTVALESVLSTNELSVSHEVLIDTVELVLTDFVVSPENLVVLTTYSVGNPS